MSIVYRVWSSIRSRQCLRHLLQFCSPHQYGCLPHRSSSMWHVTGVKRSGVITDIVKAFNCISREPVLAIALHLGVPRKVILGWQGALLRLQRRFRIRGSVGPGVHSSTGFPEGCGLSRTAAVVLGISFHRFVAQKAPLLQACSYVDNLARVSEVIQSHPVFRDWASAWDLSLDKTVAWSSCPRDRGLLRRAGFQAVLDGPDLGGNTQYALRRTNSLGW